MGHEEHLLDSSFVLVVEVFHVRKKELSAAFEIFAFLRKQILLKVLSDLLYRPGAVTNNMKAINHNRCIRE